MRLSSPDGIVLELDITGYEFPSIHDDHWDSNWLIVRGRVAHPRGDWSFRQPCLTTFEVGDLARWLEGVANGAPEAKLGYFTEPNLEFEYAALPDPVIEVRVAHECAPPWLEIGDARLDGVVLRFPLAINDPIESAAALRAALEVYHVRGPGHD